jgi:hypothetical protein
MKRLFLTMAFATTVVLLATADARAQNLGNPNLYRQSLVRPVIQPLPVVGTRPVASFNTIVPSIGFGTSAYPYYNTYVNPAYLNRAYYPSYTPYYKSVFPSAYPYYNYNSFAFPGYAYPGAYYGGWWGY